MWAQVSSILSQSTRLTDGQTEGQKVFGNTVRCNTCSRTVKTVCRILMQFYVVIYLHWFYKLNSSDRMWPRLLSLRATHRVCTLLAWSFIVYYIILLFYFIICIDVLFLHGNQMSGVLKQCVGWLQVSGRLSVQSVTKLSSTNITWLSTAAYTAERNHSAVNIASRRSVTLAHFHSTWRTSTSTASRHWRSSRSWRSRRQCWWWRPRRHQQWQRQLLLRHTVPAKCLQVQSLWTCRLRWRPMCVHCLVISLLLSACKDHSLNNSSNCNSGSNSNITN